MAMATAMDSVTSQWIDSDHAYSVTKYSDFVDAAAEEAPDSSQFLFKTFDGMEVTEEAVYIRREVESRLLEAGSAPDLVHDTVYVVGLVVHEDSVQHLERTERPACPPEANSLSVTARRRTSRRL